MTPSILTTSFEKAPGGPLTDKALSYLEQNLGDGDMREVPRFHALTDGLAISPRSRLAIRAQPSYNVITNDPGLWVSVVFNNLDLGYRDISSEFLRVNMMRCVMAGLLKEEPVEAFLRSYGEHDEDAEYVIDVLTFLDAFAALPDSATTSTRMNKWVVVISKLASEVFVAQRSLWQDALAKPSTPSRETRLLFCLAWTLNARLVFYCNRMGGQSMKDYNIELERLRERSGIPSDWEVQSEVRKLRIEFSAEHELWQQDVQLKWNDKPIDVCEVSADASADDMADNDCVICSDSTTPPAVVTKPCGHLYCQGCLETWIHACQRQSHTCPACRTQLFPKPNYVLDGDHSVRGWQEIERAELNLRQLNELLESWNWLKEERSLQKRYECEHR
jgi:hypothetical protein